VGGVRRVVLALLALLAAALLVLAVHPLREAVGYALHGDVHALRAQLRGLGAAGPMVLAGLILAHAVLFFPAEIVNATAGLVYGFAVALPLVAVSWAVSGMLAYWLGAAAGRPLALRLMGEARVVAAERAIERGGVAALLLARLIPFVPYSLVGYVAGAARVPFWRFVWTGFVGILPITAAATYLGHALDDLSASDPLLWAALGVLAALGGVTLVTSRRLRSPSGTPGE
jgi:uncharacterized membrane protein YdjX (TVP38/TMEM64 family)